MEGKIKGEEYAEEIIEFYDKQGLTLLRTGEKIAYKYKLGTLSPSTITKILTKNGVKIRDSKPTQKARQSNFIRMTR